MNRIPRVRLENGINTVALCKGNERYIFLFDDRHARECLRALGRAASNREISFDWYDAAKVSQAVRECVR